jgi:hypothetical protein
VRGRRPVRGDDAELTRLAAVVAGEDGGDRLGRREPLLEPGERLRPVDGDAGGLRGDRSDPRLCHGTTEPTAKYFDWTAQPTSFATGSTAQMEKVPRGPEPTAGH